MKIQRMRVACWMTKATDTHSKYVKHTAFHCSNGYTKAPQSYVIRTLQPVLVFQQRDLRLLKFLSIITAIRRVTICFATILPNLYRISLFFWSIRKMVKSDY